MKTISLIFALFLHSLLFAQQPNGTDITVHISNISSDEGNIRIGLYTEDTFMKAAPVQKQTGEIEDGECTVVFENVSPGNYAVLSFHDENENDTMDFDPSGMPTEAYGVSNNPAIFGPPQWEEAHFELQDKPMELEIKLVSF